MTDLKAEELIRLNVTVIGTYSPYLKAGVRNAKQLSRLIEQINNGLFGHTTIMKATMIWINLVKKAPFNYGNNRTACLAMLLYLRINQYQSTFSVENLINLTKEINDTKIPFEKLKRMIFQEISQNTEVKKG